MKVEEVSQCAHVLLLDWGEWWEGGWVTLI